ncbi:DUF2946 family protein [Bordetella sp. 2513F-2]
MDPSVIEAMARWPDVPAVHGWLSLDPRGRWRLHPGGDALAGSPGEPITNTQILTFIGRNYAGDDEGRWYFQNGPQRVYVRLDAAPFVLRLDEQARGLQTHTGLPVRQVRDWWLDDAGRLYARTDHGPGLVEDRDLAALLDRLHLAGGGALADLLAQPAQAGPSGRMALGPYPAAPVYRMRPEEAPARLGYAAGRPVESAS